MQHVFILLFDTEKVGSDRNLCSRLGRRTDVLDLILVNKQNMSIVHFL
jgi:hypothetical protein